MAGEALMTERSAFSTLSAGDQGQATPSSCLSARIARPGSPDFTLAEGRPRSKLSGRALEISAALDAQLKSAAVAAAALGASAASQGALAAACRGKQFSPRITHRPVRASSPPLHRPSSPAPEVVAPRVTPRASSPPLHRPSSPVPEVAPRVTPRASSPLLHRPSSPEPEEAKPLSWSNIVAQSWQQPTSVAQPASRAVSPSMPTGELQQGGSMPSSPARVLPPEDLGVPMLARESYGGASTATFASAKTLSPSSTSGALTPLNAHSPMAREVTVHKADLRTEALVQSKGTRRSSKTSTPEAASGSLQSQVAALQTRVAALEVQFEAELPRGGLKAMVESESVRRWDDLEKELHIEREARAALVTKIQQDLEMQLLVEKESSAGLAAKVQAMEQQLQAEQEARSAVVNKMQRDNERRVQESAAIIGAEIDRLESQFQVMGTTTKSSTPGGLKQSTFNAEAEGKKVRAAMAEMKSKLANLETAAPWQESLKRMETIQANLLKQMDSQGQNLHKFVEEQAGEARAAVESLRREVPLELRRVVSQVSDDQSQAARQQLESVHSDIDKRIEDKLAVATRRNELEESQSLKVVRQELAQQREECSSRLEAMRVALHSTKQMVLNELEGGKMWSSDLERVREDLAQKIEEYRGDLNKGLVACQERLTSTRLSIHDKVQEMEDAMKQSLAPLLEAPGQEKQGSIAEVLEKIKEVSQLREFTMDQASKLHNSMANELATLERKVECGLSDIEETRAALVSAAESSLQQAQKECSSAREFCNHQATDAQIASSKLQQQLGLDLSEQAAKLEKQFNLRVEELEKQMRRDLVQSMVELRGDLAGVPAASPRSASVAPSPSVELMQEVGLRVKKELRNGRAALVQEVGDQLKDTLKEDLISNRGAQLQQEQAALRDLMMEQHGQLVELQGDLASLRAAAPRSSIAAASVAASPSGEVLQELRLSVKEELRDGRAAVVQEVSDQLKEDFVGRAAQLQQEQAALREFMMAQHGQLWIVVEDMQAELKKLGELPSTASTVPMQSGICRQAYEGPGLMLPVEAKGGSELDQTVLVPPEREEEAPAAIDSFSTLTVLTEPPCMLTNPEDDNAIQTM